MRSLNNRDQPITPTNMTDTRFLQYLSRPFTISWEILALFFLSLMGILTRFIGLGQRVMSHDESLHVYYSWLLSTGNGFVHTPMMHGPFLFESTALMNFLFGANDYTSRMVPAILGIFIALGIPQLLKPWLGKIGAIITSLLFIISPYMLYYSRYIRHDTLVIAWMLLVVIAILGYIHNRRGWYLTLFTIGLALMFSTMEITFIYLAIFSGYIVVRIISLYGLKIKTIKSSPEFDLLVLMVTLGGFFSSPIVLPIVNEIYRRLTGLPFVDIAVLASQGTEWLSGTEGVRLWSLFGFFVVIIITIGVMWGKVRWLKLAGIFLAINVLLFTTFFTNPLGIASGFIGSLGYWLSQQAVARGGQPWYYFLIVFPLYEFLPLIGGVFGGVCYLFHRKHFTESNRLFITFVIWWAVGIFISLSLAGEKMPWLSTHITVPFLLLAAWWISQMLNRPWKDISIHPRRDLWFNRIGLLGILALILLTIRTSFMVNYRNFDYSTEFIDYARGAPGVKWVLDDIESIATHTGIGKNLKIAYDSDVSWPMSWYLKDYPNRSFFGLEPSREALDAPVVIAGPSNWKKVELLLGTKYHRFEVLRMWWPLEDYKNLSWARIKATVTSKEMRSAVWHILWDRDYSLYGQLTGAETNPPTDWPLVERMRVYIRKDIALEMLSLSLGPNILIDVMEPADAYANVQTTLVPDRVIESGGLISPRNLVTDFDGNIYALDTGNSRILKYSPKGELLLSWGSRTPDGQLPPASGTFNEPWGIAMDDNNNILVADTWNHRIQKFDTEGKFLLEWGSAGLAIDGLDRLWGPRGVAVARDGKVYVTDAGNKRIVVFSSDGEALFEFGTTGDAQLDEPVGIAIGPDRNIYITDTWNLRVAVFDPDGKYISSFDVQGWNSNSLDNKPYLALGPDNRIYLTDPEGYRVLVFSKVGEPLSVFTVKGPDNDSFGLPNGITLSEDGSVWIADAGNSRLVNYPINTP